MYSFDIERPTTLEDAVEALKDEEAQALAGGQTLIPTLKQRLAAPERLISLTSIPELKGVSANDGWITIGAATTHAEVAKSVSAYPALAALAGQIGDPAVRNRGTIGGTLANNDPAACYSAAALASGAVIQTNTREIAAADYFLGMFETALEEGEIITQVRFPIPEVASYQKFAQPASRFALVGVFVAKFADGVRVAVTGAAEEGVFRWSEAEAALDSSFAPESIDALEADDDGLIADIHGTAAYRAHLIKVLARRAISAMS
ncbi:xanthine dehydrogenase family protein subunit M [Halocynthiibacter sp. C4]|uniref:FAD binding domain-containing protein n=1 Tax=Halocynthiibacter sp. C4 TaxID=2992758 RepID=UPI00237B3B4A|nr:xanthine dehydrogenase family protein subunit M [Halocynthiibacter sp. C4]MDE0589315.1 xanthine dehydrogenase family protein subunit M [Halocynthiibacter sp. C4]